MSNYYLESIYDTENGDLIDILYYHRFCASDELKDKGGWPCPEWPNYDIYCGECKELIYCYECQSEYGSEKMHNIEAATLIATELSEICEVDISHLDVLDVLSTYGLKIVQATTEEDDYLAAIDLINSKGAY